jgi:P4 family phage/plasmid primase-like protien
MTGGQQATMTRESRLICKLKAKGKTSDQVAKYIVRPEVIAGYDGAALRREFAVVYGNTAPNVATVKGAEAAPQPDANDSAGRLERAKVTEKAVADQYGPPFFVQLTENGANYRGPNETFWAALHAAENVELYEPAERSFFRYDHANGLYSAVSGDVLKQEISARILECSKRMRDDLQRERNNLRLSAIVNQLKGLTERRGAFERDGARPFVHLSNGVLVLGDGGEFSLVPFSPDFRSRNGSPIAYDPEADCPRFLNDLLLPAVTPEDAILVQKFAGLALLGRNLIQRLLILDGEAERGKTTLAVVIEKLVGTANVAQLRTQHLSERFELSRYLGKTMLIGVDVPGDFLSTKGASVLKSLVGGDPLDPERKGSNDHFPMRGDFNILITSNSRLRVHLDGDVGAWRRRLCIVRYEAPPLAKKIPGFADLLIRDEGSGILRWALDGLRALLMDISEVGDIRRTERQAGIVDSLLAESDSLRYFLKDRVATRAGSDLTVQEIIERYAEFCPSKGWDALPITVIQRQLEGLMLELFSVTKSNSIERPGQRNPRGFRGVEFCEAKDFGV